jgi:hypothetical protein
VALSVVLASVDVQGFAMALVARQLTSLTSLIQLVMLCLIVSWIVHEDPVVDREAMWLTRPIDPMRLTAAKLTMAGVVLILLPFAGELVTMGVFRVSAYDMARATPVIVLNQMVWVLVLTAAATLTPSLTRYVLVIVAAAAAIVLLMSVTVATLLLFSTPGSSSPRPEVGDPLPTVVATVLAIAIALWVIFYQYRRRRAKRAATFGTAGLLMTLAVPIFWPWHVNRAPDPDPGAWSRDEARVAAVFNAGSIRVSDMPAFRRQDTEKKQIAASVVLTGMPDDVFVQAVEVNSQLELAGATLRSRQTDMGSVHRVENSPATHTRLSSLRSAMGSLRLLEPDAGEDYELWPVLLNVTEPDFARYGHTPGRLTATVDFYLHRWRIAGAIPLEAGRRLEEDTRRIEIVRVDRRADGCTVLLRDISITPLFLSRTFNQQEFVLRNGGLAQAIRGDGDQGSFGLGGSSVAPFLLALAMGGGDAYGANGQGGSGFAVRTYGYRYPARMSSAPSGQPVIDGSWLGGAEMVRVKTEYVGHVMRSLTVNNFRMAE